MSFRCHDYSSTNGLTGDGLDEAVDWLSGEFNYSQFQHLRALYMAGIIIARLSTRKSLPHVLEHVPSPDMY